MKESVVVIEERLQQMIEYQRLRVIKLATALNAKLTGDDIMQPHDFPELAQSVDWNYEDGVLAGLLSAQIAIHQSLSDSLHRLPGFVENPGDEDGKSTQ